MVDEATMVLEAVANKLWLPWVEHLIPNVACRVGAEVEARAQEEHNRELREEAKCLVNEKLARAVRQDKQLEEKLMEVLEGQLSQAVLEVDSEAEEMGEAEGMEAVMTEDVGTTGGTQLLATEVDEKEGEDVVMVEEVKQGEMRTWALVVTAQIVKEEGMHRDSDTNASRESGSGEFGAGESGGGGECGEHGKTMLEVHQALSQMHHAQQRGTMRELPSETLWVFAHAAEGGHGRQRWIIGVPTDEGGDGKSDERGHEEGQEGHHVG